MAIPVLRSGITPPIDWLARTLFGTTEYQAYGLGKWKPLWNLGIQVCRNIAGTSSYSQHAFGNALDIAVGTENVKLGDELVAWLKTLDWPAHILWRGVANHYPGHIHIDANPYGRGIPPCDGGPAGPIAEQWPLTLVGEDDMASAADTANFNALIGEAQQYRTDGKLVGYAGDFPATYSEYEKNPEKFKGLFAAIGKARAKA